MPQKMDLYKPFFEVTEPLAIKPKEYKIMKRVGAPYVLQKADNLK